MSDLPELTVVTATYNRGAINVPSTRTVLAQTYGDFIYQVVDDGSTDDSADHLASLQDPRLQVIRQTNRGFTRTLIETFARIETPYVAFHDAGDRSHPERFQRQIERLKADPRLGAVGCNHRVCDPDGRVFAGDPRPHRRVESVDDILSGNIFNHGDVMMRTEAYRASGGYRALFRYCQDYDLWIRMARTHALERLEETLYDQVMIPGLSVGTDLTRIELSAILHGYAVHLEREYQTSGATAPTSLEDPRFEAFRRELSLKDRHFVGIRLLDAAFIDRFLTGNLSILPRAAARALEYDPGNRRAARLVRFGPLLRSLDGICPRWLQDQFLTPSGKMGRYFRIIWRAMRGPAATRKELE